MEQLNATMSATGGWIEFIYPGPDCEKLCVFAITTALFIVIAGSLLIIFFFCYFSCGMPSKKAEAEMAAVRAGLRREWDERKAEADGKVAEPAPQVKTRKEKKKAEEQGTSSGTNRSSSFYHVSFKPRAPPAEAVAAVIDAEEGRVEEEMKPLLEERAEEPSVNPLRGSVPSTLEQPADIVVEPVPIRMQAPFFRHSIVSYDTVYETPRASIASFRHLGYGSETEEEYLDARSHIYEDEESAEEDRHSDRTLTLTSPSK